MRQKRIAVTRINPPQRRKVLLIGWDAADWKVIHPLMDGGKMPALKHLVETGSSGNLASLDPPMSPIMWTSIATGMTADKHGVLGFTQPRADGKGVQPVLASSRKVKALWNILMQSGLKTHVIGWWPSHPAEKLNGVSISNFYHRVSGQWIPHTHAAGFGYSRTSGKNAGGTAHPPPGTHRSTHPALLCRRLKPSTRQKKNASPQWPKSPPNAPPYRLPPPGDGQRTLGLYGCLF